MADRIRTPRRRKMWAVAEVLVQLKTTGPAVLIQDLLGTALTQLGITAASGVTVMRTVGWVRTVTAAQATTPVTAAVEFGLSWITPQIAGAAAADGQIPEPLKAGLREHPWYHQWPMLATETGSTPTFRPEDSSFNSWYSYHFDVTNMQKQPAAGYRFGLIGMFPGTLENDTTELQGKIMTMIALP